MGLTLGASSFGYQGIGSVGGGGGSPTGYYGAFSDLTLQQFVANTITPLKLNTTDLSSGVSLQGTPQTQIKVANTGVYNIQFSAQLNHTTGGTAVVTIWLRKNGVDVPATSTDVTIEGNTTKIVPAWNFLASAIADDYFELMVSATDDHCEFYFSGARTSPIRPSLPSLIVTVTQANPTAGSGGGSDIAILDEGVVITSAVTSMDFIGSYIHATAIGNAVAVNFDDTALLKRDGSSSLTANWNAGAYGITANTFTANNGFSFNAGLGGTLVSATTTGSAKTWTLPNESGTILLSTSTITPTNGGTGQTSYVTGDTLYASATNVLSRLPIGSETDILSVVSGVPAWVSSSAFTVPILVTNATNLYLLQNT
jgi:hypothetical protein